MLLPQYFANCLSGIWKHHKREVQVHLQVFEPLMCLPVSLTVPTSDGLSVLSVEDIVRKDQGY